MRILLLIAVLATCVSITSSADAEWLRSRRSSGCANGQCGLNSAVPAAAEQATDAVPPAPAAEETAPPAAPIPPAPAATPAPAPATPPAAAAPASQESAEPRAASANSSRTRTANYSGNGRLWRRFRSRL